MKKYNFNIYQIPIKKIIRMKEYWNKPSIPMPKKINNINLPSNLLGGWGVFSKKYPKIYKQLIEKQ
tara:strand:- start:906 stop:1103 length:198 start_codon:yes stop_codon:yes gene_type:complete